MQRGGIFRETEYPPIISVPSCASRRDGEGRGGGVCVWMGISSAPDIYLVTFIRSTGISAHPLFQEVNRGWSSR